MAEQAELTRPESREEIQTVNPATGQPGKELRRDFARRGARGGGGGAQGLPELAPHQLRRALGASSARPPRSCARARTSSPALMTEEMGKTLDEGRAEVEKCAFHCDWFADHAAGLSRRRAGRHRRRRGVRHLQSDRRRARRDAVEFPLLAGLPLRRAGADGRQRRAAEARQQRAGLRARDRGGAPPGRRPARTCSARCCCRAARSRR